jgi:hypothetical protein
MCGFRRPTTHTTSNQNIPLGRLVTGASAREGGGEEWTRRLSFSLYSKSVNVYSNEVHVYIFPKETLGDVLYFKVQYVQLM